MKIFKFLLLFLLMNQINPAQFGNRNQGHLPQSNRGMNNFFTETHLLPSDSAFILYYSFRIPYKGLVFLKENNHYTAGYNLLVEILNNESIPVSRQIKEIKVVTDSFDITISNSEYSQALLTFNLDSGEYRIITSLQDFNSTGEKRIPAERINTREAAESVLEPMIIFDNMSECESDRLFRLANFGETLPFGRESYDLLIPVADTSVSKLEIIISNKSDTLLKRNLNEFLVTPINLKECNDEILIDFEGNNIYKNFILKDFSFLLNEDNYQLGINLPGKEEKPVKYPLAVNWINKPFSLRDPLYALNLINLIESDSVFSLLMEESAGSPKEILYKYWEKIDPTPSTAFNELMYEYYLRVDYVLKNFSTISGKSGVDTDRGRVFVKYGKPDKIIRSSNEDGEVVEKWYYLNKDISFTFVDDRGTGDFRRIE